MVGSSELDPAAILAALGVTDTTAAVRVSGGWDTVIWRVERGGVPYALRLFRAEQAGTARREVAAMRAVEGAGLPVPRVEAEGAWEGRPALLLSWCPGQPLIEELRERPWGAVTLGKAFGRVQAAVHAVPAPDLLRQRPEAWLAWAGPEEEALQARLRALAPRADALLHLDYHPLNVLGDGGTGGRVTCVLDWANALAGDPRADLARTLTILRLSPTPPGVPAALVRLVTRLFERGWRAGYRQVAGPQRGMAPFYAWAGAMMVRDLAPKVGRPGIPLEERHLEAMRAWTARWKRRAGLTDEAA